MWRPYASTARHLRLLLWLDGLFLRLCVRRAMAISGVVGSQLKKLAKSERFKVEVITPTYAPGHFDSISRADHAQRPFRVLFNGRVEANKGIFDLVEIADRLNCERPGEFQFDVCGDGSEEQAITATAPISIIRFMACRASQWWLVEAAQLAGEAARCVRAR